MNDKAIAVNADWVEQIFDGRGAGSIDTTTGKECPALRTSSKRSLVALGQVPGYYPGGANRRINRLP